MIILLLLACGPAASDVAEGLDGSSGIDGINGLAGNNGANGQDGSDGSDGEMGTQGEPGVDGIDGADGVDGVDGIDGVCTGPGWADAAGVRVIEGSPLIHIDALGYSWEVDRESAILRPIDEDNVYWFY